LPVIENKFKPEHFASSQQLYAINFTGIQQDKEKLKNINITENFN
jgi:hypothetical protein